MDQNQILFRQIGRRIRNARVAAGLTQQAAANQASLDYKRWQKIEQGAVNPTVKTVARIATALGMSFWTLLSDKPLKSTKRQTPREPKFERKVGRDIP